MLREYVLSLIAAPVAAVSVSAQSYIRLWIARLLAQGMT